LDLQCGQIKLAVDTCVNLNQWDQAVDLAKKFKLPEIGNLLAKYATHLLAKDRLLEAVELYRKANHYLEAAKLLYQVYHMIVICNLHPVFAHECLQYCFIALILRGHVRCSYPIYWTLFKLQVLVKDIVKTSSSLFVF
jgi:tetratricopeptide (TPR) repeat protein